MKRTHLSSILLIGMLVVAVLTACSMSKAPQPTATPAAITAYQALLKESPALEGEHIELEDASFGYDENMAKFGKHYDYFAVIDLNQDDVPELITMTVINKRWTPISVFTYRDNAIVLLSDPTDPEAHATFEQMATAGGEYTLYICKDGHLHNMWSGDTPVGYMEETNACGLTASGLIPVNCAHNADDAATRFADVAKENTEANRNAL